MADKELKVRKPEFRDLGMVVEHDQPCAILYHVPEPAVIYKGVFHPSWKAQADGWRLVQAKTRIQRLVLKWFFGERT